jgi:TRAP-type C4-dicarboxylate transport system substrate-binding protein
MIDGQVNPVFAIEEMKFYEVSDYMIWAGQQQFTTTVITNNNWFNTLSAERQQQVEKVIAGMNDFIFDKQAEFNQARLEQIKQAKPEMQMIQLDNAERAAFKQASMTMRDKYVELTGKSGKAVLESLDQEFSQ